MGRRAYAVLAVAGVLVALLPLAAPYLLGMVAGRQRDTRAVYEENVVGVRYYPEEYFARLSPREFAVLKPLSWSEHTFLTWNGYGDFKFTFPGYDPEIQVFHLYIYFVMNCTKVREFYDSYRRRVYGEISDLVYDRYRFLLEDNCYRFMKFLYDREGRSWYASLTMVGYFRRLYMEGVKPPYYVWALVRFDQDAMRVKFYNVANDAELFELMRDLTDITEPGRYPKVLVAVIQIYPVWYRLFEEALRNGTYVVALYAIEHRDVDYYVQRNLERAVLSAVHEFLAGPLPYNMWVLLEGGELAGIYSDECGFLLDEGLPCRERDEYFDPAEFR